MRIPREDKGCKEIKLLLVTRSKLFVVCWRAFTSLSPEPVPVLCCYNPSVNVGLLGSSPLTNKYLYSARHQESLVLGLILESSNIQLSRMTKPRLTLGLWEAQLVPSTC